VFIHIGIQRGKMAISAVSPWQYRGLGRLEAEKMLVDSKKDGAFLVRESESMKGAHVLSVRLASLRLAACALVAAR
jgi:hypothetical protein